jgi:hypothetical protein
MIANSAVLGIGSYLVVHSHKIQTNHTDGCSSGIASCETSMAMTARTRAPDRQAVHVDVQGDHRLREMAAPRPACKCTAPSVAARLWTW